MHGVQGLIWARGGYDTPSGASKSVSAVTAEKRVLDAKRKCYKRRKRFRHKLLILFTYYNSLVAISMEAFMWQMPWQLLCAS